MQICGVSVKKICYSTFESHCRLKICATGEGSRHEMHCTKMGRLGFAVGNGLRIRVKSSVNCPCTKMAVRPIRAGKSCQGPHCRLLDQHLLSRYMKAYSTSPRIVQDVHHAVHMESSIEFHRLANRLIKGRQRGLAEWIYLQALSRSRQSVGETLFLLALLVQKRDSELARCAFRLCVQFGSDVTQKAKHILAWGLFESKQSGRTECARSLLRRSVAMDPKLSPVLRWKVLFENTASKGPMSV